MRVPSTAVSYLVNLLLLCAVVEFTFMRVLLRSGPALDADGHARQVADAIVLIGHTAMNLGVVVGVLLLGLLSWRLYVTGTLSFRVCSIAAVTLAATIVMVLLRSVASPGWLVVTAGMSIVVIVLALVTSRPSPRQATTLVLFGGAYVALFGHYMLQALSGSRSVQLPSLQAYYLGEVLVVLAAVSTLLLIRGSWSWKRTVAGAALGGGFLAARSAVPWLISTIGIWNFGVTMSLPAFAYGVGLACCVTAVLHLWTTERFAAAALIFMTLGGMKLDVVYFHLLGVTGFLLLVVWVSQRQGQIPRIVKRRGTRSLVGQPSALSRADMVDAQGAKFALAAGQHGINRRE